MTRARSRTRAALAGLLGGLLLSSVPGGGRADDQAAELERLREENARLQRELEVLKGGPAAQTHGGEAPSAATTVAVPRSVTLHTSYDAERDQTTVSTDLVRFDGGGTLRSKRWLKLGYTYPGREVRGPVDHALLTFIAGTSNGRFRDAPIARIEVDQREIACEVRSYEVARRRSGSSKRAVVYEDEELTIAVPTNMLDAIANGRDVRLRVGAGVLRLSPEQQALFAAVRSQIATRDSVSGRAERESYTR